MVQKRIIDRHDFLQEIPQHLLEETRMKSNVTRPNDTFWTL